jgi:hypothetical protein
MSPNKNRISTIPHIYRAVKALKAKTFARRYRFPADPTISSLVYRGISYKDFLTG